MRIPAFATGGARLGLLVALASGCATGGGLARNLAVVEGPTVIAFFPAVSQAEVDAGAEIAVARSDYRRHLARARVLLASCEVTFHEFAGRAFQIFDRGRTVTFRVPAKSPIGYCLKRPGQPTLMLWGARTDVELVAEVTEYFGCSAGPSTQSGTDTPAPAGCAPARAR